MTGYLEARGWLSAAEREALVALAAEVAARFAPAPTLVNIGVEYGASLHCLRAGAPGAQLVGVDLDCTRLVGHVDATRTHLIAGDSAAAGRAWRAWAQERLGAPAVHLVFVDGGHTRDAVHADIVAWTPHLAPGGLLAFHDYSDLPMHAGVVAAVDAWVARTRRWTERPPVGTLRVFQRQERAA
jgi:cephalosporin hydroxylase